MKYFVIDTETNGLKCGFHELTEISILDCQTLEQITWMIRIRNPERSNKVAMQITNKTPNELASWGRYIESVLDEINNFLIGNVDEVDEICMIAHSASFDRRFMEHSFQTNNKTFVAQYWLDTVPFAKKFAKQYLGLKKTSVALERILVTADIKNVELGAHSSEVDVRNTFRLWKYMVARGMSNTEFIKMSPTLLQTKPTVAKGAAPTIEDAMWENPINYEEDDDDDDD